VPGFNPGVNFDKEYKPLDPPIPEKLIDLELTWNRRMTLDMSKITDDMVKDTTTTSDLLCSPGKYSENAWKHKEIYQGFGPTFLGNSNLPKEAIGIAVNGSLIVQALTAGG